MKPLSNQELLQVWEQGLGQHPIRQALLLLRAACPEVSPQALAELSVGQRDGYLLTLREWLFGPRLTSRATCPKCDEPVELTFDTADIRTTAQLEAKTTLSINVEGYEVRFRLPNSMDLLTLGSQEDQTAQPHALLERCIIAVEWAGQTQELSQLPAPVVAAVIDQMAQVDPQAEVQLALTCPVCTQEWTMMFDVVTYFWEEINHWAYRTLHEVHLLASAYGWSEADILALSRWKRQFYLQLVNG